MLHKIEYRKIYILETIENYRRKALFSLCAGHRSSLLIVQRYEIHSRFFSAYPGDIVHK